MEDSRVTKSLKTKSKVEAEVEQMEMFRKNIPIKLHEYFTSLLVSKGLFRRLSSSKQLKQTGKTDFMTSVPLSMTMSSLNILTVKKK
jgi:hypothetical protein